MMISRFRNRLLRSFTLKFTIKNSAQQRPGHPKFKGIRPGHVDGQLGIKPCINKRVDQDADGANQETAQCTIEDTPSAFLVIREIGGRWEKIIVHFVDYNKG